MKLKAISVALLSCLAVPSWAADRRISTARRFSAAANMPKVLTSSRGSGRCRPKLVGRPASSLLDEVLSR